MIYAGFFRRVAASFIDAFILIIPITIFGGSAGYLNVGFGFSLGVGLVIAFLYRPIFESSVLCGTPGKAMMGLVVVSENEGTQLTFKKAFIRFLASYLSLVICYIGYLMQPFTSKRQTLHDMISESVVIRRETPDLNYFVVWRDQLKIVFNSL